MLDLNLGSIVEALQHIKDDREREAQAMVAIGAIVSGVIQFNYSLGKGLQMGTKSKFLGWLGYCFTHFAGTVYKIYMTQTLAPRIIIGAPMDLVNNTPLLDAIHVEQILNKKTS